MEELLVVETCLLAVKGEAGFCCRGDPWIRTVAETGFVQIHPEQTDAGSSR